MGNVVNRKRKQSGKRKHCHKRWSFVEVVGPRQTIKNYINIKTITIIMAIIIAAMV